MSSGASFSDGISHNIEGLADNLVPGVHDAMVEGAEQLVEYAQANAPWADRTGEAREGLDAEVYDEGSEVVIELFHTAEHGKWLELAMAQQYAIIMPTLEALGPDILNKAAGLGFEVDTQVEIGDG